MSEVGISSRDCLYVSSSLVIDLSPHFLFGVEPLTRKISTDTAVDVSVIGNFARQLRE